MVVGCVLLPTSRLSAALTKTHIKPPQKLTSAAKSSAVIQPNFVAMYAVEIGAIPPARLAQVFINPESEPACSGVKSIQVSPPAGRGEMTESRRHRQEQNCGGVIYRMTTNP